MSMFFYIMSSLAMTTVNKHALSELHFPAGNLLLLAECASTALVLFIAAPQRYKPFSSPILQHVGLCTIAKAGNVALSFMAMKYTSIPVYNVLKRLNPFFGLGLDTVIRKQSRPVQQIVGVVLIAVGATVTGMGDLDMHIVGYVVGVIASTCQASYLVLASRATDKIPELTPVDLLFYTAFYNSFVFLALGIPELEELAVYAVKVASPRDVIVAVFLYVVLGAVLNWSTFWCTAVNSPVTTGVAGNFKGILSTIVGVLLYGSSLSGLGWIGLSLNTAGGIAYSLSEAFARRNHVKASTPPTSSVEKNGKETASKTAAKGKASPSKARTENGSQSKVLHKESARRRTATPEAASRRG